MIFLVSFQMTTLPFMACNQHWPQDRAVTNISLKTGYLLAKLMISGGAEATSSQTAFPARKGEVPGPQQADSTLHWPLILYSKPKGLNVTTLDLGLKMQCWSFPGGPEDKNTPASAGNTGSIPDLGGFHMLQGN